ncbi:MAG: hypothetical protein J6W22_09075 [Fibrobacter sp.]|nr:hypothetical protein [Fibrobacter sp.]
MRYFIFILLFAMTAFAQEADLYAPAQTPVKNPAAQPQYVQYPNQPQYNQQAFYDSTAYYQNLMDSYIQSGNSKRSVGKAMMLGGGIAAVVGGTIFFAGLLPSCDEGDDGCEASNFAMVLIGTGDLILLGGIAAFTTGLFLKIKGRADLRKAERFSNALTQYNYRRQHSLQLQIEPIINARKGSYGSRLSLNF